jgi:hypothetical protein
MPPTTSRPNSIVSSGPNKQGGGWCAHVARVSIGAAAAQAVDQMSAVMGRCGAIGGITMGFKTLDNRTDGPNRGATVSPVIEKIGVGEGNRTLLHKL